MNTNGLFHVLSSIHPLSEDFKKALEKELIPFTFPKNHILLDPPRTSEYAYFLDKGFAMSYCFIEGKKITESFWHSGQIMVAFESFFEQQPSLEAIQLMTKSDVLCISYASVQRMFETFPETQKIYRGVMNHEYEENRRRMRDMRRLNALQRFQKLLLTFPDIELIVPQDAIASYLGITAQSLSRLKRNRSNT
ncbi:MAG TPA: Crp/Fnr family transcriptional regulator [Chryseolinea sp.]|nr:Crp/Fnr family transcriptional regulator [Chryseolinea sp.]